MLRNEHTSTENNKELLESLKENETHKHLYNQLDTEITGHEIINATKKIKTKKAAYSDQISNEMIKACVDILIKGFKLELNTEKEDAQRPRAVYAINPDIRGI